MAEETQDTGIPVWLQKRRLIERLRLEAGVLPGQTGPDQLESIFRAMEAEVSVENAIAVAREAGIPDSTIQRALRAAAGEPAVEQQEAVDQEAAQQAADQEQAAADLARAEDTAGAYSGELTGEVEPLTGLPIIRMPDGSLVVADQTVAGGMRQAFIFKEPEDELRALGGFPLDYEPLPRSFDKNRVVPDRFDADRMLGGRFDSELGKRIHTPQYFDFDNWRNFASKSPAYIASVQQALVAAGYVDDDDIIQGFWDFESAKAMEWAMIDGNASGRTWVEAAKERAARRDPDEKETGRGPLANRFLQLPAFSEPDYASLSQSVKTLFRNQLNRDPQDYELALLADRLNTDYRSQYDAEVAAAMSEFQAGNHALLAAEGTDGPIISTPGSVQGVDPIARLMEQFETKYGPELALNSDRIEERQNLSNVFDIFTRSSSVLTGGRA